MLLLLLRCGTHCFLEILIINSSIVRNLVIDKFGGSFYKKSDSKILRPGLESNDVNIIEEQIQSHGCGMLM